MQRSMGGPPSGGRLARRSSRARPRIARRSPARQIPWWRCVSRRTLRAPFWLRIVMKVVAAPGRAIDRFFPSAFWP